MANSAKPLLGSLAILAVVGFLRSQQETRRNYLRTAPPRDHDSGAHHLESWLQHPKCRPAPNAPRA